MCVRVCGQVLLLLPSVRPASRLHALLSLGGGGEGRWWPVFCDRSEASSGGEKSPTTRRVGAHAQRFALSRHPAVPRSLWVVARNLVDLVHVSPVSVTCVLERGRSECPDGPERWPWGGESIQNRPSLSGSFVYVVVSCACVEEKTVSRFLFRCLSFSRGRGQKKELRPCTFRGDVLTTEGVDLAQGRSRAESPAPPRPPIAPIEHHLGVCYSSDHLRSLTHSPTHTPTYSTLTPPSAR